MKKRCLSLGVALGVALAATMCGFPARSEAVVRMKLGMKMTESHHEGVALRHFTDTVKKRTNGEIVIDIFYGEVLGDSKKQIENMIHGLQDFYAEGYSFYDAYVPEFRVIGGGVPYLFKDNDHYKRYLLSDMQKDMEQRLIEKAGLRIMNRDKNWLRGPYRVLATKKPVLSLEDLKGLKLRMASAPLSVKAWENLGASVIVLPYSETYLALKQGTVDAVTCPVTDALYQKFCEVAPHLTVTHEYQQQVAVVMNEKRFQSLTKEQQEILYDALREAGDICTKLAIENGEKLVKEMKEKYGVTFHEVDLAPWREKIATFIPELEKQGTIPAGFVEKVRAIQ